MLYLTKKNQWKFTEKSRYSARNKEEVVNFILWLSERCPLSQRSLVDFLDMEWSRFQRWKKKKSLGEDLADKVVTSNQRYDQITPEEIEVVCRTALKLSDKGYRYLAWYMVDHDQQGKI